MDMNMQWAISQIVEKVGKGFYGSITLVFKDGKLQCLKTEQVQQPETVLPQ